MAANNDNAMARFLFAILRQKDLKDIDWNQVASDPVLLQPITNGHAARMRFSRFRSAMLGIEPQRRNRTNGGNSRVTKTKKDKDSKDSKHDKAARSRRDENVKEIANVAGQGPSDGARGRSATSAKVKQEGKPYALDGQAATSPTISPAMYPDSRVQFQNRLMTPCSDTDIIMAPQRFADSPVDSILHQDPFDFPASGRCGNGDQGTWHHHSPTYPTFGMNYELDAYAAGFSEQPSPHNQSHPHLHHNNEQSQGICVAPVAMESDSGHASVKHEAWDSQFPAV